MKTIENKLVHVMDVPKGDGSVTKKNSTYTELINDCLQYTGKDGFSFDDIQKRSRIYDKVQDNTVSEINFEDADFENLRSYVTNMRWAVFSKGIMEFCNDIINHK